MSQRAAVVVLVTLGMLAIRSHGSQQAMEKNPSNTWQMRCVVKVTAASDVLPLSFELVESLLRSDAVAGQAACSTCPKGRAAHDSPFDAQPLAGPDLALSEAVGPIPAETQTVLFALRVHLDNDVGPVAREFGSALIENLGAELQKALAAHRENLHRQLSEAEARRETLRKEFEDLLRSGTFVTMEPIRPDPADEAVAGQLQKVVDLSELTQLTPVSEAFEVLRNSVEPPLNIVVLWRDLFDNANIEPSSPVQFDGPSSIRLGTALGNLLSALNDPLAVSRDYLLDYVVDGGGVTVGTRVGLPRKKLETRVYNLPPLLRTAGQTADLAATVRETIEPESWHNFSLSPGGGTITPSPDGRLIVLQSRDVHIRIQELLAKVTTEVAIALPEEASPEALAERLESLLPYREQLEQELDRLQERQVQIEKEKNAKDKQAMRDAIQSAVSDLHTVTALLEGIHADMRKAKRDDPQNTKLEQAIQTLSQCRHRCSQASPGRYDQGTIGAGIFPSLWSEEQTVAERITAKQRDLREVSRRIAETHRMMAGSKVFDTELRQVEWTARRYEQADAQVHDIKTRLASLQPCAVTVIGGIE